MKVREEIAKAQAITLKGHIQYMDDSVVSKTIIDKETGSLTLFAFDAGQGLSEHTTPFDAVAEILEGEAKLNIGGQEITAQAGQIVVMPANVPHSITAEKRFKMMLSMIHS